MPGLQDVNIINCNAVSQVSPISTTSWNTLERLVLRKLDGKEIKTTSIPRLPPSLRILEVGDTSSNYLVSHWVDARREEHHNNKRDPFAFKQLGHLRLSEFDQSQFKTSQYARLMDSLSWFVGLLAPSISNGTFRSLDIPFDTDIQDKLDQVLDKQAIHSLSCNSLPPTPSFQPAGISNPQADALLAWLEGFPNLTTVGLYPKDREVCAMMVARLLAREESSVRTIYTNELVGVYLDDALNKAEAKGIEIVRADRVPAPELETLQKESGA